jgi:hypothetical protein
MYKICKISLLVLINIYTYSLLTGFNVYAQFIPRAVIESEGAFEGKSKYNEDYDTYDLYKSSPRYTKEYKRDVHRELSPYTNVDETDERMNAKFEEWTNEQKKKSVYFMLGVNEIVGDDDIEDMFGAAVRISYEDILEQYLDIKADRLYPYASIGSKGISMSLLSYAIINTDAFKFYLDPFIFFVDPFNKELSLASGVSAGYYHDAYSAWGIEVSYKYLWSNPYDSTETRYYQNYYSGRVEEEVEEEGEKHRHLFGVYLVWRL